MIQSLIDFDKSLFLFLNGMHSSVLDSLMVLISSRWLWIPLYAYLLVVLIKRYQVKSIYIILMVALLVTLCDQLSVHLFKNVFMRLRPCHEPSLAGLVHIVDGHCGGQFGFVSSHASNVFGLAFFIGSLLKSKSNYWMPSLIIWASIVSYSRIYLGVHYPLDVICGAFLGIAVAQLILFLLATLDKRFSLNLK